MNKRAHLIIPEDIVIEIDEIVGKRGRSQFLAQAARKELKCLRLLKALEQARGAWQDQDHPELKSGAASWVKQLRTSEEKRFQRLTSKNQ